MAGRSGSLDAASLLKRKAAETNAILHFVEFVAPLRRTSIRKRGDAFLVHRSASFNHLNHLIREVGLHQGKVPRQVGFIDRASN